MSLENNTQVTDIGATNPVNGANETLPQNEGEMVNTQPQVEPEKLIEDKKFSQKDLDNIAAKARGTAERETQKKLLAQLGLNSYDENVLTAMKEAYQNSLTDAQKRDQEFNQLNDENLNLMVELDQKDYVIEALAAMSGKKVSDVEKIVKMAQGLKTDDNTVEDCIKEVLAMININTNTTSNVPTSKPLSQPSATVTINADTNPFKQGASYNLTEQARIWKDNPELARRLAGEAGIKLNF